MSAARDRKPVAELDEVQPVEIDMREARSMGDLVTLDGRAIDIDRPASDEPEPATRTGLRVNWLFVVTVVVPVLASALYLFVIAADRFQSEAKFVVRSSSGGGLALDAGGAGVGGTGPSLSRAGEDAYIVDDYITSRDALDRLVEEKDIRAIFSRPEADAVNRFPPLFGKSTREHLYDYYQSMVKTWVDSATGISTVQVTAFRPDDALQLNRALLAYAESVVNRINDRANADRVAFAEKILGEAKATVAAAEKQLTDFRSASGIIDPTKEYQASLQNISRLSVEASQREAALSQQMALTPNAPGIASQREKVKSYRDEIARLSRGVAGGADSLAVKVADFERLMLERDIATKELVNAEANLDASQKEAGQQRLYLQTVVSPNLPDMADAPHRLLWFAVVLGASLMLFTTLRHLKTVAEEHAP